MFDSAPGRAHSVSGLRGPCDADIVRIDSDMGHSCSTASGSVESFQRRHRDGSPENAAFPPDKRLRRVASLSQRDGLGNRTVRTTGICPAFGS